FFGGSFTGLTFEFQKKLLEYVIDFVKEKNAVIRISTYPEYIDNEKISFLKQYKVKIIELGVQSLNENVLKATGRFYNTQTVYYASNIIKKAGLKLGHQIMIGLPGSSSDIELDTITEIKKINPDYIRIYPVVIVKNTELEQMYILKNYKPLLLDEIIDRCVKIMFSIENTGIKIIRIGLHSETGFVTNSILNTGSYHPALGELVKSEYIFRKIKNILKKNCNIQNLNVKYPPNWISLLFGQKNKYIQKYDAFNIIFSADKRLKGKILLLKNKQKIEELKF
ncbi:radical SAM protein, partial [Candidatus Dependentiae bacterium]|nr:radical SAM protein [Candidatus Dependentiae bacterium]